MICNMNESIHFMTKTNSSYLNFSRGFPLSFPRKLILDESVYVIEKRKFIIFEFVVSHLPISTCIYDDHHQHQDMH